MNPTLRWLVALAVTSATAFSQQHASTGPSGRSDFVRWGAEVWAGRLRLTRIDVNWNTSSISDVQFPANNPGAGALTQRPTISPDDDLAAIPVPTNLGGTMIYVLRNIRAPSIAQSTGYWIPYQDPNDASYQVMGPARFRDSGELWVLEGDPAQGRATRLARYRLDPTNAVFLGASNFQNPYPNQTHPNPAIAYDDWLLYDDNAVVVEQREFFHGIGIDVVRFASDGSAVDLFPVNDQGYSAYRASIFGIRSVLGHPNWGFLQYVAAYPNDYYEHAQFIDLDSGSITQELFVSNQPGRMSSDGSLALFRDMDVATTLLPVKLPTRIYGQALTTLPEIPGFFCGDGDDTVATDGGDMVTAPNTVFCTGQHLVHRTRLNPAGQLDITSIPTDTANGPFFIEFGLKRTFTYPGMNRVYSLCGVAGQTLLNLNVTPMTYGPETMSLTCTVFF